MPLPIDRPSPLAAAIAPRYREAPLRKRSRLDSVENPSLCEFIHSQTPATVPSDGQQALANRPCRFCLTWRTIIRSTGDVT